MTVTHTLRSFHLRAKELKRQLGSGREAWEETEKEYIKIEGKKRYKNYNSFRINHWNCINQLKKIITHLL